jgi:hypothetical protein
MTSRPRARSLVLAAAVVAMALLLVWRRHPDRSPSAPTSAPGSSASGTTTSSTNPTASESSPTPKRVTRLTPERRAAVASQIQAAKAARARPALPPTPTASNTNRAGAGMTTAQEVLDQFLEVSDEIRGYVKECASTAPDVHEANTSILLTGDPDIGTLIDAPDPALGRDGQPVPAAFDECIRGALQTLELPPMQTGSAFKVTFQMTM